MKSEPVSHNPLYRPGNADSLFNQRFQSVIIMSLTLTSSFVGPTPGQIFKIALYVDKEDRPYSG